MNSLLEADWSLFLAMLALVIFGLVMIFSSSAISAFQLVGSIQYFFRRQVLWSLVGLTICLAAVVVPFDVLKRLTPLFYAGVLVLLGLVLIPGVGREAGGARRWIDLGPIGFQPSELAKLAVIMISALYMSSASRDNNRRYKNILVVSLLTGVLAVLIALEPDIGTAFQIALIGFVMLFVSGFPYRYLVSLVILCVPLAGFTIFTSGYRRARVLAYLNPWADPLDKGYHAIQFMRTLQTGGFTGVGLGESVHKMGYLPEPFTDSIVAILGEELGLIGILALIVLVGFLVVRGFMISLRARDVYQRLVGVGISSLIGIQAALNLSVVSGVIPTTGVSMPFISYGGSSLVVNMTAVGLLLNISRSRSR